MLSYAFLVNDYVFGNVILQQGIRQGEVLLGLFRRAQESGLMTSIKLARHFMVHPNTTRLSVSSHSTRTYCKKCAFLLS